MENVQAQTKSSENKTGMENMRMNKNKQLFLLHYHYPMEESSESWGWMMRSLCYVRLKW